MRSYNWKSTQTRDAEIFTKPADKRVIPPVLRQAARIAGTLHLPKVPVLLPV
jgi:hypothetical protein